MEPNGARMPITYREPGVMETNIGDEWRARWVDSSELPDGVEVTLVRALIFADDKGYALRPRGTTNWIGIEDVLPAGEAPDAYLKRILAERVAIKVGMVELIGFQACRATRHNTTHAEGALTLRPLYIVAAKSVETVPPDSAYERRRMPLNEYAMAMRARYPEIEPHITTLLQRYAVMLAKGELRPA